MRKQDVIEYIRRNPEALSEEFIIKKRVSTTKKTFEVEDTLLHDFMVEAKRRGLKVKEAIGEAIEAWLKSKP